MQNNQTNQTAVINYTAPRAVNIGDVFYMIARGETKQFYEPCKVCNDTRNVTVNGVTFTCPCCNRGAQAIFVQQHVVHRYRVYSISDEVENHEWKAGENHKVKFGLYRKVGLGWGDHRSTELWARGFQERLNAPCGEHPINEYGIYDDYKLAVSVAERMNEIEFERLKAYNDEHGTHYEVHFTQPHDAKSK
ncbi:MAG: hypothetical protein NC548_26345 [Lachnospiraceae bacterium]|nr:hypothetical protein [Lachnospiraceae bacterium]